MKIDLLGLALVGCIAFIVFVCGVFLYFACGFSTTKYRITTPEGNVYEHCQYRMTDYGIRHYTLPDGTEIMVSNAKIEEEK